MPPNLSAQQFVTKWKNVTTSERASAHSHFNDLCALLGQPTPLEADPAGNNYAFERGATKSAGPTKGGHGWADVWKRGCFAWEYKKGGADLDKAYGQLLQYREALDNPPLLVVSDMRTIQVHTNITNTSKQIYTWTLDDLLVPGRLDQLRRVWTEPFSLQPTTTTTQVTEQAAKEFAKLAEQLRKWGEPADSAAHFLIRILFCLFAEDIGLLPDGLFSKLVERTRARSRDFAQQLQLLFDAMRTGGMFGIEDIAYFNGGLFDSADVIELDSDALTILQNVTALDWSAIEPSILGTLFERSLDPAKRSQLGAHYTSRDDILLIVEPVLMAPLRRQWTEVQSRAQDLVARRDAASGGQRTRLDNELRSLLLGFQGVIAGTRVLDPACGSGNFLYVALKQLLDLEKEVIVFFGDVGLTQPFPLVSPEQLRGIELNEYAHELAQVTVWIGYIQWLRDNGFGHPSEPILKPLDTIKQMDAILAFDADGRPVEPTWPDADVIIGNPPFLGDKKMRTELGDTYVELLRTQFKGRVPAGADLVTYWFERARELVTTGRAQRVGLLATNSIAGGINRRVLERIKGSGNIFMAWNDRPWVLDGAAVRVAMVGFDRGQEQTYHLNGLAVRSIGPDLHADIDLTQARQLVENKDIAYIGDSKKGQFDIPEVLAMRMLTHRGNPHGRPNSDVVRPWANGLDVTNRPQKMWIIDFGVNIPEDEAALYEQPFEYIVEHVKPVRVKVRNPLERTRWWLHARPAPELRTALSQTDRYIATSNVAKHRLFVWLHSSILPSHSLTVFVREDDYFLGLLQSKIHMCWALRMGTSLEDRPRYTPSRSFETYPFPWPPGAEPVGDRVLKQSRRRPANWWSGAITGSTRRGRARPTSRSRRSRTSITSARPGSIRRIGSSTVPYSMPTAGRTTWRTIRYWLGCLHLIWSELLLRATSFRRLLRRVKMTSDDAAGARHVQAGATGEAACGGATWVGCRVAAVGRR